MGLFGGLFSKKTCDICGGEIGLLGNRKLEDGNCCKECAKKLSYWFDERRHSTVDQIKEQLAYRERNLEEVKNFHVTRTISCDRWSILLDESSKKFILTREARKIAEENPDVIAFSDITGCRMDVDEDRDEIKREVKDGDQTRRVSYNPPRYEYSYDFHYHIHVNNPYFDEMKFDLNRSSVHITPSTGIAGLFGGSNVTYDPHANPEYAKYEKLGEEITKVLTEAQQIVREEAAMAAAGPRIATCPFCGAQTEVDAGGKCQYCGGYVGDAV
jgi:hypothetical protein